MKILAALRDRLVDAVRRRKVTSRGRAGAWGRTRERQRLWDALVAVGWKAWPMPVFCALIIYGLNVAPIKAWYKGALTGGFVVVMVALVLWALVSVIGAAPRMAGAAAELETARALSSLSRRAFVAHDVQFPARGNADHVVVGQAGVFVVETKWTAPSVSDSAYERGLLQRATTQARQTAKNLRLRLFAVPHQIRVDVRPIVVLWGGWDSRPDVDEIDGVPVIRGSALAKWMDTRIAEDVHEVQRPSIERAVASFVAQSDRRAEDEPASPMVVQHGPVVLAEGSLIAFGVLLAMVVALNWSCVSAEWWFVAIFAAAVGAWFASGKISHRARVRAWLIVSAHWWSGVVALGGGFAVFSLIR